MRDQLRAALDAPEQPAEPVGEIVEMDDGLPFAVWRDGTPEPGTLLYAHQPPQRQPLTVAEMQRVFSDATGFDFLALRNNLLKRAL